MADGTEGGDWYDILFGGGGGGEEVGPPAYLAGNGGGEEVGPPAYLAGGGSENDSAAAYAALYGDTPAAAAQQGGAAEEGGLFSDIGNFVTNAGGAISNWASKIFTNQPSTTTRINPATGKPETIEKPGGGLNSLGQLLIAGALQGVAGGMASKSKQEAEAKEKKKERSFEREKIAEGYARKEYGAAPQIGQATRGTGLLYNQG